ncbi:hypothetical protein MNQ98_15955 [Paenibacillus sp. N3/727]|uniref:hypothetical protein n=1 Tax=Paenibacillus sp. N3/727 TaxID=2925845 RepID=UPI001F53DC40|nr:hypothetical protein [Paenibacillus sp. N3/727]UNK16036.1 hypothetical protein MNQ98_15955 [Paenibacillus sp. N3/727]
MTRTGATENQKREIPDESIIAYKFMVGFWLGDSRASFMAGILIMLVLSLQFLLRKRLEARWKYLLWLPVAISLLLP